jgi:hypothetical protein
MQYSSRKAVTYPCIGRGQCSSKGLQTAKAIRRGHCNSKGLHTAEAIAWLYYIEPQFWQKQISN